MFVLCAYVPFLELVARTAHVMAGFGCTCMASHRKSQYVLYLWALLPFMRMALHGWQPHLSPSAVLERSVFQTLLNRICS